jgi:hypothetical protein
MSKEASAKAMRYALAGMVLFSGLPAVHAQEFGKIRAREERTAQVLRQRNDFVAQVLTSYAIPHQLNDQGIVVRIHVDNRWLEVNAIDIVPLVEDDAGKPRRVAAHRLLFQTSQGVMELLSELTIR